MLVDLHILQNHAPSNLNRDDTGAPKDCIFGGVQRARISSQCLKRSMRKSAVFREAFGEEGLLAQRTRLFPDEIRKKLVAERVPERSAELIAKQATLLGRESTKRGSAAPAKGEEESGGEQEPHANGKQAPEFQTKQLMFLAPEEVDRLADKLLELFSEIGEKKFLALKAPELADRVGSSLPRSVDVAMFGRMTTSEAFEDVQAAVQVAHAISTHRLEQESDYYTAVDDISGEAGAGFIGDIEFNSATYYKYLSVHWEGLIDNLGGSGSRGVAARSLRALIEAAALVQPSGKQNTFAAHNLPDLVMVEVRERNLPVSYANAFVLPVRPFGGQSLVDASATALASYVAATDSAYGLAGRRAHFATGGHEISGSDVQSGLLSLLDWTADQLEAALEP
jgi:CRISPR system Cascade subunit CasC